ncbi:glycosyltransferase [Ectothiorhodospira variabilis]|uniref:glycosyltransferase n=1 Tax=Ectothiorhodospira variabilis TaxID=505694 RepID=UPI001EFC1FE4|nr:glycosyltransferase [Ectothiorhodospira variabilis]MCG5493463.1 glycosyltransferase [Ectothiorhodospira variabilis]MCG5496809.1 glycosyltransferase [Ectothiorhodospira variabilis]MCG5502792.1 glycosyltransferase [Ectothiorhodospira variabilis]MCG5506420.1 glycosyltransferase [Ectothiorhodospira variabilis]
MSLSGEGGVERMILNLANQLAAMNRTVNLILIRSDTRHLTDLHDHVKVHHLGVNHTGLCVPALARFLSQHRPQTLLAAKDRAGRAALRARRLAGVDTRIYIRLGTTLTQALEGRSAIRKWLRYRPMRRRYPESAGIIAVSHGVAEDVRQIAGLPASHLHIVRNPVITEGLARQASASSPHPWLSDHGDPVIMGMGRLTRQKDFPTLMRAFARLLLERPARLLILGDGADRRKLEDLAGELGILDRVLLPGFDPNPYAWLSRASLFVLSSAWEGSPNALTEAMALGIPVVSTDCRSGPRELLDGGRLGPLVPVGDDHALSRAMREMLDHPTHASVLKDGVKEYHAETSARRYLEVMGLQVPK